MERARLTDLELTLDKDLAEVYAAEVDTHTTRRCDTCNACCTALEVFDLPGGVPKPMGCRCPHLVSDGKCGIYEDRPMTCRLFYCSWRLSEVLHLGVRSSMKPDRCGFVLHYDRSRSWMMTAFLDPARPKEWLKWKKALERLARNNNCLVVIGGGTEATHSVTPRGRWIARADHPDLFELNGVPGTIGCPKAEFFGSQPGVRHTKEQRLHDGERHERKPARVEKP